MNGQAKVLIPTLIGIITLLLTGITGISFLPGEQQAIQIAETRAITLEQQSHQVLATAFRDDADTAALQMEIGIAEDLAVELKHVPANMVAAADSLNRLKAVK